MKTINDVYGHLNGDLAIKATAEAFIKYSPDDWLFGRYGGDEFIAVGSCPSSDTIENLIKQISESMSNEFKSLNLAFTTDNNITGSLGNFSFIKLRQLPFQYRYV